MHGFHLPMCIKQMADHPVSNLANKTELPSEPQPRQKKYAQAEALKGVQYILFG